jgi:hypothetical protein
MKYGKYILVVLMLVITPLIGMQAIAHPPDKVDLVYDLDMQILYATITHVTIDPNSHYIYKVEIEKNSVLYLTELYTSQPTMDTFTYNYSVEADVGDELTVTAFCSLFGSLSNTIVVTGENNPPLAPEIDGPDKGIPDTEYTYVLNAIDPEDDDVRYHIDWDDGDTEITSYSSSGTDLSVSHNWSEEGTYTITVQAEDINGLLSSESTLKVKIPRVRASHNPILLRVFDRFSVFFQILNYLLKLQ